MRHVNTEHENGQISNDWDESMSNLSIHLKIYPYWANYVFIRSSHPILYRVKFSYSEVSKSFLSKIPGQDFTSSFRESSPVFPSHC